MNKRGFKLKSWVWGYKSFPISVTFAQHLRGLPAQRKYPGIDVDTPVGTPLYAPYDGTVYQSSRQSDGAEVITLRHSATFTQYAHLKQRMVTRGKGVVQGQLIGYSGNTGVSSAPHLHFALISSPTYIGSKRIDPYDYLLSVPNPNPVPPPVPADPCAKVKEELAVTKRLLKTTEEKLRIEEIAHKHFADRVEILLGRMGQDEKDNKRLMADMTATLIARDKRIEELELLTKGLLDDATLGVAVKTLLETILRPLGRFCERIRRRLSND